MKLALEIPEATARRLEAFSSVVGKSIEELAIEGIEALASSHKTRRALMKAWRSEAKLGATAYSFEELGWLNGYAGQTVDELLCFEATDHPHSILFALEEAIRAKLQAEGPLKATGVMLVVLSVQALERDVNNGGFDQFFRNSSRKFAPRIVPDLVRIGCPEMADIAQRAIDALELPKLTVDAVENAMSIDNVQRSRTLERCDLAFYEHGELAGKLLAYAKARPDGIVI